jgi:hypothetical protein
MEVYSMAIVLNMKALGFRVPPGAVYVGRGRGSKFGNPFEMPRDGSREEVIEKYEAWLLTANENSTPPMRITFEDLLALRGKDLVCWCAPEVCHADVLLKYIPIEEDASATQERLL